MPADWSNIPQSEWNRPTSVADAIAEIQAATDRMSAMSAYHRLLYALGNNHAGTYYPIAVAVIPALKHILESEAAWPKSAVLEALIDLTGSFIPELDCLPGSNRGTRDALYEAVTGLRGVLESLINSAASEGTQVQQSAKALVLQLAEIAQDRREAP